MTTVLCTFGLETETFTFNISCRSLLGNYKWQLHHICRATQFYMEPVHCEIFWPFTIDLYLENLVRPFTLFGNNTFQLHHIFRALQHNMGPVHCGGYLDLLTFNFEIMTLTLKSLSVPLLGNHTWQLLHILQAHPNIGLLHCRVTLTFWPSTLNLWPSPWKYCMCDCSETIYISTASYFQGRSTLHDTCAL